MRDSADRKSLREIKQQKEPIVRLIRRERAKSVDSVRRSTKVVSVEDLRKFYRNEAYTLFADEEQRSTAESILYQRPSLAVNSTRSEPARSVIRSFGSIRVLREQRGTNNTPYNIMDEDNAVEL